MRVRRTTLLLASVALAVLLASGAAWAINSIRCNDTGPCEGTAQRDSIIGTGESDDIRGFGADDRVVARAGNDVIRGGYGPDTIFAEAHHDDIFGGPEGDFIVGGKGRDEIYSGSGSDYIRTGSNSQDLSDRARDYVNCGPGRDRVTYDIYNQEDRVVNCEVLDPGPVVNPPVPD